MSSKTKGFGRPSQKQVRQWQKDTARLIKESGRAVIAVMANEDAGKDKSEITPAFAYTLGNSLQDEPFAEIWTCYPSRPTMSFVLNHISDAIRDGELDHLSTEPIEAKGFIGEEGCLPVRLRLMTEMERVIAYEAFTCQLPSAATPVCIAELPDPAGHFADDPECHPAVVEAMANAPFRVRL